MSADTTADDSGVVCAYCGEAITADDAVPSPDDDSDARYCSPLHASKHDHNPEPAEMKQGALPGTVHDPGYGDDDPTHDPDAEDDTNDAPEPPEPPTPPSEPVAEPGSPDANPGGEADKPVSPTDPSDYPSAITEIDPASPAVDTSGWPKPGVAGRHVPTSLRDREIWAVWTPEFGKTPMAPWATGHMYRAKWGADTPSDERPEAEYEQANMVAEMNPERVHDSYSFPPKDDGDDPHIPDTLYPTILLPHEPPDPPIMLVDFDDVRDPDTGAITPEVQGILRRLDSYTEVSQSGEGLHTFVRARLPGALGKFIAGLDMVGDIEMYDHGRFVGCTWRHLEGTPKTVRTCQDDISHLIERYETESQRKRRLDEPTASSGTPEGKKAQAELDEIRAEFDIDGDSRSDRKNAYYHIDVEDVAWEGRYGSDYFTHREQHRSWANGPHPAHGPEHSDIDECTNFGIKDGGWSCFAHDGGGGAGLSLLAVIKGVVSCDEANSIHNKPAEMLKTCLYAREATPSLEDEKPPYTALRGVADQFDLTYSDAEKGILGEQTARIARKIFDEMEPSDVDSI